MGDCGKINGIMMVYLPGIFTYIWVMFEANVGNYCVHGALFNGLVYGKIETGKPHDLHGKIDGFRLRFPLQPIHILYIWKCEWILMAKTCIPIIL